MVGPEFDVSDKDAAMSSAMAFLAAGLSAPPAKHKWKPAARISSPS